MNFEIKYKDAMGRVGILKTPHGNIKTPALMPVIHPGKQTLDVKKFGAEIVITNAYIMYKNEDLRAKVLEEGVHKFIDFPGPIVTDSGSFQLSVYGDIDVTNREIIEFQEAIGTDIGTSLDIPTPPYVKRERAERELEITLERAKEALDVRDKLLLNSVVQGSTFPDLRSRCADEIGSMGFDVYPIGAVVPLMESYKYSDLLDVVMASVTHLPESQPRHLMGAGHPMVFAFAVAMGCDLFDSAAYILYAKGDRFMMPTGTYKLENLVEMPCSCPVCNSYTPEDLRGMEKDKRMKLIAQHNLHISLAEIRTIRQAIVDGNLMELVEQRCRSHPYLLDGLRNFKKYTSNFEEYDPASKNSAFFYSGPESLARSEIYRHLKKMERLPPKENLLLLPRSRKPYSKSIRNDLGDFYKVQKDGSTENIWDNLQVAVVDVPFAVIPLEIDEVYPLAQNESPLVNDLDSLKFVKNQVKKYIEGFNNVIINEKVLKTFDLDFKTEYYDLDPLKININDKDKVKYIADYQFGSGSGNALFKGDIKIIKSKKTGKIRHVYDGETLIATLRASDGVFVLDREGARRLHSHLEYPKNRVAVNADAEPFAKEGKSIFAKFVIDCDINIKSNEEVLIVNQNDDLIAFGKAILCGREIMNFNTGQAVKTRKGGL
ncbi:7-cyano-7-deazaguanine tRNA-ribosyltransferase [Methanobacterium paludis]|uniref:tRNA-guanine(15) transglycosylase n=2 Tax=Methanobacterium paludis (strain DSM 25820 / JCM 18151 / SWAN1) TaxID=868131 RepID=F6D688_METPW|nr:tRNA guanosine(15) transglycosylase TgtA [Methanobacterium paludis]AEG18301.1 7-cyano-7-deazaguanine tRNA-ribosyltransferase [Methanobacterium paludis]